MSFPNLRQDIPRPGFIDPLTRIDDLLVLNINIMKQVLAILTGQAPAPPVPGEPLPPLAPLVVPKYELRLGPIVRIFDAAGLKVASTTYYPDKLANCVEAIDSVLIIVRSSCDQALTVQAIGDISDRTSSTSAFNIEAAETLAAGATTAFNIVLSDKWFPYLGVAVTTGSTAPTSGSLNAWVYIRKWVAI